MNKNNMSVCWLFFIACIALFIWVKGGWFHLELLPVSELVRVRGILTVFDWQVFDINPARLRPLSDLVEVIDAMLKPPMVVIFGHHPSMTLTSLCISILAPVFFYGGLRSLGQSRAEAIVFTAFLISTIGFLSCFVPYIRPAKRLAFLSLCLLVFLAFKFEKTSSKKYVYTLIGVEFLALFTDEAAFIYWPIFLAIIWKKIDRNCLYAYLAVPLVYLFTAKIIFPPIYNYLGKTGARNGVVDHVVIIGLLKNILSIKFWGYVLEDISGTVSASFGTLAIPAIIPLSILVVIIVYSIFTKNSLLLKIAIALIASSIFFSWLDMINTSRNYMGQWTYYYHTPIALFSVLLAAIAYEALKKKVKFSSYFLVAIGVISLMNISNFYRTNEILKTLHLYPISMVSPLTYDQEGMARAYEELISNPPLPQTEGLRKQFEYYKNNPMGTEDYVKRLNHTYEN